MPGLLAAQEQADDDRASGCARSHRRRSWRRPRPCRAARRGSAPAPAGRRPRRRRCRSPASRPGSAAAMPAEPSSTASSKGIFSSNRRWVFSMVTVESSTSMPTASASPPRVMVLMVWPSAESTAIEVRIESGIETMTIRVERQEPRKIRIIRAVSPAAISALAQHAADRLADEDRLVEQQVDLHARAVPPPGYPASPP